ncbi:hypothetical protein MKW92_053180, partial [Papaver armeniacum]
MVMGVGGGLRVPKQHPSPPPTTIVLDDGSHGVKLKDERSLGSFESGQESGIHTRNPSACRTRVGSHEDIISEAEVHVKIDESAIISNPETWSGFVEQAAVASENNSDLEKPLDLDDLTPYVV